MTINNATEQSRLEQAVDRCLIIETESGLADLVAARRGVGRSWRSISREIEELIGFTVASPTVAKWFPEHAELP